jgi:hypothetical protein
MSPKRPWWLLALGSLIAVTAFGSWGCCSVRCCGSVAKIVVVSPTADGVSVDPVVISKEAGQEIVWRLPAESTISNVAITLAKNPDPFVACQTTEGICHIACENRLCPSGPVNPALYPPKAGTYYGYVFGRPGSAASADPGFIIRP